MPAHFLARAHSRADSSDDSGGNHSGSDLSSPTIGAQSRADKSDKMHIERVFLGGAKLVDADCNADLGDHGLIRAN